MNWKQGQVFLNESSPYLHYPFDACRWTQNFSLGRVAFILLFILITNQDESIFHTDFFRDYFRLHPLINYKYMYISQIEG